VFSHPNRSKKKKQKIKVEMMDQVGSTTIWGLIGVYGGAFHEVWCAEVLGSGVWNRGGGGKKWFCHWGRKNKPNANVARPSFQMLVDFRKVRTC